MQSQEPPPRRALLLLGAGASMAAGVPMTVAMLAGFRERTSRFPDQKSLLAAIEERIRSERIKKHNVSGPLDIEPVMEAIHALEDPSGTVSAFFDEKLAAELRNPGSLLLLRLGLQDYIRDQCMVRAEALGPLRDLRRFFESFQELDIFTVNYDIVVELLCELDRISYSDGFKLDWEPGDYSRPGVVLRLYKLHGSAIWSEAPARGAIKVPLRFQPSSAQRLTGEESTPLMVYPAEKWNNSNIFLDLNIRFANALRTYDWLLVSGYSFRDRELNNAIFEAARDNPVLQILIVSPDAEKLYERHLKRYTEPTTERRMAPQRPLLENRVFRLPFNWERVLAELASTWYGGIQGIQQTVGWYQQTRRSMAWGRPARLDELVIKLLESGAIDQADEIAAVLGIQDQQESWLLKYHSFRAFVLYTLGRESDLSLEVSADLRQKSVGCSPF